MACFGCDHEQIVDGADQWSFGFHLVVPSQQELPEVARLFDLVFPAGRWCRKQLPTFSDALAAIRRQLWTAPTFATSPDYPERTEIQTEQLNRLLYLACHPA